MLKNLIGTRGNVESNRKGINSAVKKWTRKG